jgi:hypothetical protein
MSFSEYPFLKKFMDKHRLALQNKSKDVRFTVEELGDIMLDLTGLALSVSSKHDDNSQLKALLNQLLTELKLLNDSYTDGGRF